MCIWTIVWYFLFVCDTYAVLCQKASVLNWTLSRSFASAPSIHSFAANISLLFCCRFFRCTFFHRSVFFSFGVFGADIFVLFIQLVQYRGVCACVRARWCFVFINFSQLLNRVRSFAWSHAPALARSFTCSLAYRTISVVWCVLCCVCQSVSQSVS